MATADKGKTDGKQTKIPGTDTKLSKIADRFLDARDTADRAKKKVQSVERELLGAMKKAGKKSVKHSGVMIKVKHTDERDTIQVARA